jgi:hypothetical protein
VHELEPRNVFFADIGLGLKFGKRPLVVFVGRHGKKLDGIVAFSGGAFPFVNNVFEKLYFFQRLLGLFIVVPEALDGRGLL